MLCGLNQSLNCFFFESLSFCVEAWKSTRNNHGEFVYLKAHHQSVCVACDRVVLTVMHHIIILVESLYQWLYHVKLHQVNKLFNHYELHFLKVRIWGNAVDQGWTDLIFVEFKNKVILLNQLDGDNELTWSDWLLECFSYQSTILLSLSNVAVAQIVDCIEAYVQLIDCSQIWATLVSICYWK